jgi:hypothetical protein
MQNCAQKREARRRELFNSHANTDHQASQLRSSQDIYSGRRRGIFSPALLGPRI